MGGVKNVRSRLHFSFFTKSRIANRVRTRVHKDLILLNETHTNWSHSHQFLLIPSDQHRISSAVRLLYRKMAKVSQPELKRFIDKRIAVNIQGGRKIQGTLRGFDMFLNLVVDDAIEQVHPEAGNPNVWQDGDRCGTVVVRGNSVTSLEALENVKTR